MFRRLAAVVSVAALLAACSADKPLIHQETVVFGTRVVIKVDADAGAATAAINDAFAAFQDMHRRFYPWRDGELRTLNRAVAAAQLPMQMSAPMAAMMRQAKQYSDMSEGLFNPAIGKLVELWGFHTAPPQDHRPPPAAELRSWKTPSMAAVRLEGDVLAAAPAAAQFDFGALAKGAALDAARDIFAAHGINNALIDVGGSVLAMGKNGGRRWRVALFADRQQQPLATIALNDGEAVSTSGGSERFFIHQGRRYHHILDPRSGEPATKRRAAIVISGDPVAAGAISDAAATALVIADNEETKRILNNFNITLAWQAGKKRQHMTPALKRRLQESD